MVAACELYTRGADQGGMKIKCYDWGTWLSKGLSFLDSDMLIPIKNQSRPIQQMKSTPRICTI